MSWEEREHSSNRYYTRSRRVGGRVLREYVGSGPIAEIAADLDVLQRIEAAMEREGLRQEVEEAQAIDLQLENLGKLSDLLVQVVFWPAGYHQHKGEWRKRRGHRYEDHNTDSS